MSLIRINNFRGIAPRYAKRQLGDFNSQKARNVDLWSRELRSIRSGVIIDNPSKLGEILSIFPLDGNWLHWSEDVDVAQSPLNVDDEGRIYYTGQYNPKSTNSLLAVTGSGNDYPLTSYRLGLPAAEVSPSIGITGGASGIAETRSYTYTYVTEWGEEGPPVASAEYVAAHDDAASWDISNMDVAPLNTGVISAITVSGSKSTFTTTANHFLETGDYADLTGIVGTGNLPVVFNDVGPLQITRIDATHFSIELAPSGAYTSGGAWTREASINTSNMTKRIYRTSLGVFKFVAEIPVAQTTYTDTVTEANLGEDIPGVDDLAWSSPNGDLKGITVMAGGITVGFYKNVLSFSVAYAPHAYPAAYELTLDYTIVSIEAIGNTLIVGTVGKPYAVTGVDPAGMTESRLDLSQSCISKRSIVSILNGAMYASPDGLVYVPTAGAAEIITRRWLKETDWRLFNPSSITACVYDDRYYGFYSGAGEQGNESGCIVFDPSEPESTFTELGYTTKACYSDLTSDSLYYFNTDLRSIYQFGYGGNYETFEWLSKAFTTPGRITFKAGLVRFTSKGDLLASDMQAAIDAAVAAVDSGIASGDICDTGAFAGCSPAVYTVAGGPYFSATSGIGSSISATFRLYADGVLKFEKQLVNSKPFRIPGGYRSDTWEIELSGNGIDIHEAFIAETMSELARA